MREYIWILEPLQTIVETLCLIVATGVGVWGLNTWRNEIVGRRKLELAEDVLAMFYEARDIFGWVRFPGSFGNEGQTRKAEESETEEEKRYKNALFVPIERLQQHHEFFGKLQSMRYRFIAYFGVEAAQPFDKIKDAHSSIVTSARMLVRTYRRYNEERSDHTNQRERWENDIGWWTREGDDKLNPMINEAVAAIERTCKPYLIGKND
jgi:hypothetical protein